ncbi:septal ring lytic transglycosylase RlpA family protein [Brevundimonas sp.]|uniref:septal ring lytic transglycosylase RlpA family protein n=1 Tax=Brevundimonas sp. TaxID=1871086 RepID=UPI0025C4252A|nr:septal ring lytic transglycosylase RlpA family protein [Brevundimonas sp.]
MLLTACASVGGSHGPAVRAPVVMDPAPIVLGTMRPYQIKGRWYRPAEDAGYDEVGMASWYGAQHNGRPTASGETFDMNALTAAHKTLPLPGLVEVTNLENGRQAILRINDRGPFSDGRIIDLSRGAAQELGLLDRGVGRVRVRYVGRAPRTGGGVRATATRAGNDNPAREAQVAPLPAEADTIWVQAAIFASRAEAEQATRRLGEQARLDVVGMAQPQTWRVLIGPWPDANAAERARQAVVARGYGDALLISGS